jgi:hypothetical protein
MTRAPFPQLSRTALYGLPGDVVRAILPHSEADPAALLVQTLALFGNCVGRHAYFVAEDDKHYTNLYVLVVGDTSKSRKGTSLGRVQRVFRGVDDQWMTTRVLNGLSSGEGIISAVRNPSATQDPLSLMVDEGEPDKRLMIVEGEFASALSAASRHGNTLSAAIRRAWDSGNLNVMTRTAPLHATDAHISIIGHITREELCERLSQTDRANGFANRFLFVASRRSQLLPNGGKLADDVCDELAERLRTAVQHAQSLEAIERDEEAQVLWSEIYEELATGHDGLVGMLTSRAEAQVMRLATIYALMDCSPMIKEIHLEAAYSLWQYCEESVCYLFGSMSGDRTEDQILRALLEAGDGLTVTDINQLFSGHKKSWAINRALLRLLESGAATSQEEQTGGRPVTRWFAVQSAEKAEEAEKVLGRMAEESFSAYSAMSH